MSASSDEGEILSDTEMDDRKERTERQRSRSKSRSRSEETHGEDKPSGKSSRDYRYKSKGRDDRRRSRSRSRDRGKSRDSSRGRHDRKRRHKHKSRSRYRRYSSDSRSSSRSRSGHRRRRSRSYDSYSSNGSRDYGSERGNQDRNSESYKHQEPNSTVMVRGLASHLTEQDIRQDILKCGIMVKDIRLIRHRDTGASRGFAFVEFQTVQEAIRYMEMKQGSLVLQDEYHATLIYSVPKVPYVEKPRAVLSDWYCTKCQGHNFKRRDFCYKCHNPRPDEHDPELTDELSSHPTTTIILYNLDALTTEEGILQSFKIRPALASIPIRSVRIARESITNLSRGVCYVETNNVADSVRLYTNLLEDILIVDGRQAGVAYSKPASHGPQTNSIAATALAAAQWGKSQSRPEEDSIESMAQYSASLYATTSAEHASYLEYYREYYRKQPPENINPGTLGSQESELLSSSSSKSAPDTSIVKSSSGSHASDQHIEGVSNHEIAPATFSDKTVDVADTSRYQYDETSGYYYDPVSGLYYDPQSQYFYDATKQQFLYWDAEQGKYLAVTDSATNNNTTATVPGPNLDSKKGTTDKKKDKKSEKQDKVKVAKKIAKDMEKWAKTLNQKKDVTKVPVMMTETIPNIDTFNQVQELATPTSYSYRLPAAINSQENHSIKPQSIVASYESDSDEETKPTSSSYSDDLVDFHKLACLLCKRQFPNKDVLIKHTKLSELHKKNLELKRLEESSKPRDRAKERRDKFGSDPVQAKNSLKDLYMQTKKDMDLSYVEEPTRQGIRDDNIGNRLLQKMGWQEGQGLGRDNHGRTNIITTERRQPNTGLGMRTMPVVNEDDDRYSRARKLTLARYQELE